MIARMLPYLIVSAFVIWLWNDAPANHKDNLFYLSVICSQIGFYIFSRKLDSLRQQIAELKNHSFEEKQTNKAFKSDS